MVNPGATIARVTFNFYRADGTVDSSSNQTIPARGQFTKLGSELFPDATTAGWVEATSAASGLQGFWLAGDFVTFADGAEAAVSSAELILPVVAPQSEIHVANPGVNTVTAFFRLYGEAGFELALPVLHSIPPKGFFKSETSLLFPSPALASATHIKLTCVYPFAATVVLRDFIAGPSWAVANAVPSSQPLTELHFPQVIEGPLGGANYQSIIGLTNLSTKAANDVTLTFTAEDGLTSTSVQKTIPSNGAVRDTARSLFGLGDGYQNGWVKVTGALPLAGFVAYADIAAGGVALVSPQPEPQTNLLFGHIADLPPWRTGVALLNPSARNANVEIFAVAADGSLIGGAENVATARFVIPPGTKTARLLSERIPQSQTRLSDGGFIFIRSDVPLYGTEIFFTRSLLVLSNVGALRILPGITYTPPPPR